MGFMVPNTDNLSNVGITTRGIGEYIQETSNFGNDSNTCSQSRSTHFLHVLAAFVLIYTFGTRQYSIHGLVDGQ
jgi:hypothetical protein